MESTLRHVPASPGLHQANLLAVINPNSGSGALPLAQHARVRRRREIRELVRTYPHAVLVQETSLAAFNQRLPEVLRTRERWDAIAVYGGDGTQKDTLTTAINTLGEKDFPFFLPLRGGTVNAMAQDFGTAGDSLLRLGRVFRDLTEGACFDYVERGALRVQRDDRPPLYGTMFCHGVPYRLLQKYREDPSIMNVGALGLRLLAWALLNDFPDWLRHQETLDFSFDERRQTSPLTFILAFTLDSMPLGFHPNPRPFTADRPGPQWMHFVASLLPIDEILRPEMLTRVFYGRGERDVEPSERRLDPAMHINTVAQTARFETTTGFALDGDLYDVDKATGLQLSAPVTLRIPLMTA